MLLYIISTFQGVTFAIMFIEINSSFVRFAASRNQAVEDYFAIVTDVPAVCRIF